MVEDSVTDGKRIAQLLASELSSRERGRLADVAVTDADPDVEPDPDGQVAYRVTVDGDERATVHVYPDAAEVRVSTAATAVLDAAAAAGLPVDEDERTVRVESGAAVKAAFDAVRESLG
jgi:hypothetical protein